MDGIMPTIEFFAQLIPILLICAGIGVIVGYRDLPNRTANMLTMLIAVWACTIVSWLVFTPKDASLFTHAVLVLIFLAVSTATFIAGAKAGERWRQPYVPDHGNVYREWRKSA